MTTATKATKKVTTTKKATTAKATAPKATKAIKAPSKKTTAKKAPAKKPATKAPAKKVTKAPAKKVETFEMKMEALRNKTSEAVKVRQELEKRAREAKYVEQEFEAQVNYMRAVDSMAGWTENNTLDWTKEDFDVQYRKELAWQYSFRLRTVQLSVYVNIAERTDMKKFKYEVTVHGTQTQWTRHANGYVDHDAVKKLVKTWRADDNGRNWDYYQNEGALEMKKKFAKLEEAEAFAKEWKELIDKGFEEVLKQDRELFKLAKASK